MSRMIKNISWLTLGNVVVKPLWFVFITAVCLRFLGIAEYGVMIATLALASIVVSLIDFGTSQYSIREVARYQEKASLFFSNFFLFRIVSTTFGVLLAIMIGFLLGYRGYDLVALIFACCYIMAQSLTSYCHVYYRSFEIFKYEAISVIVEKILVIGFGVAFLLVEARAAWVLAGLALGMFLTLLGNIVWLGRRIASFSLRLLDGAFLRQALPQAFPLGLASIFVLFYLRTDSVMLEAIQGKEVTGQYGLAYRFIEALVLLPGLVVAVFLPRLSQLFSGKHAKPFQHLMVRGAGILGTLSVAIALGLMLTAPFIMHLLDPDATSEPAVLALQILIWSFPFSSLGYLLSTALTAMDDQKALAWMLGIAALFNISLNSVLIPIYSLYGACAATVLTEALLLLALAWRYRNRFTLPTPVAEGMLNDPAV